MKLWIICSGETEAVLPRRCTAGEYNALRERALDGAAARGRARPVAANGRRVYCSPRRAARETAEGLVTGAQIEIENALDELFLSAETGGRKLPPRLWRLLGADRAEGARRAEALIERLEAAGADCVLVSHPAMIAALIDALRPRGYCVQRTGLGRIKPWEQMLLSRRDEHCGGCGHNCLLSNPGCNIGRDKAARMKK